MRQPTMRYRVYVDNYTSKDKKRERCVKWPLTLTKSLSNLKLKYHDIADKPPLTIDVIIYSQQICVHVFYKACGKAMSCCKS